MTATHELKWVEKLFAGAFLIKVIFGFTKVIFDSLKLHQLLALQVFTNFTNMRFVRTIVQVRVCVCNKMLSK